MFCTLPPPSVPSYSFHLVLGGGLAGTVLLPCCTLNNKVLQYITIHQPYLLVSLLFYLHLLLFKKSLSVQTSFPKLKLWETFLNLDKHTYRGILPINCVKNCLKRGLQPVPLTGHLPVLVQQAPLSGPSKHQQHFNKSSFSTLYISPVNVNCFHNKLNTVRDLINDAITYTWYKRDLAKQHCT